MVVVQQRWIQLGCLGELMVSICGKSSGTGLVLKELNVAVFGDMEKCVTNW